MKKFYLILTAFFIAFFTEINAQDQDLEIYATSGANVNGPLDTYTVTFLKNTDNPTANSTATYPNTLQLTYSVSNKQYGNNIAMGLTGNNGSTTVLKNLISGSLNPNNDISNYFLYGLAGYNPTDPNYPHNGIGISAIRGNTSSNYGVQLLIDPNPFVGAGVNPNTGDGAGRPYVGDLTLTFSRPVKNPVLHFGGMGASQGVDKVRYNAEYELINSNVSVSFQKISGKSVKFQVDGVANTIYDREDFNELVEQDGGGSVLVRGTGIISLTFKILIRGLTADGITNNPDFWANSTGGEQVLFSASVQESDLSITKTVNTATPIVGSNVIFTINATNNGISNSPNTKVQDLLPAGYTYVSSTASTGTYNSSTGEWNIGTLNNGATATLTITATANASGSMVNTATITGDNSDPNTANNTDSVAVTAYPDSDNDGVADPVDLDDDNDGILDTAECAANIISGGGITVLSGDANNLAAGSVLLKANALTLSNGNKLDALITIVGKSYTNGSLTVVSDSGQTQLQMADVYATDNPYFTYKLQFVTAGSATAANLMGTPVAVNNLLYYVSDIDDSNDATHLHTDIFGNPNNNTATVHHLGSKLIRTATPFIAGGPSVGQYMYARTPGLADGDATNNDPNYVETLRYATFPAAGQTYVFGETGSFTGLTSRVFFHGWSLECDTDQDGIPNRLDLDSDNDGCLDAIEGDENVSSNQLATAPATLSVGTGSTAGNQNIAGAVDATGVPVVVNSGGAADIGGDQGQGIGSALNTAINPCSYCYKLPQTSGTSVPVQHGITSLGRAGADNSNWPMVRNGAWTVLEAKTKGFVVNRMANPSAVANPVEGMMVYDTTENCLKIYNGTTWSCYNTQTCP